MAGWSGGKTWVEVVAGNESHSYLSQIGIQLNKGIFDGRLLIYFALISTETSAQLSRTTCTSWAISKIHFDKSKNDRSVLFSAFRIASRTRSNSVSVEIHVQS